MKTIFRDNVRNELIKRMEHVTPLSERRFGRMTPDQMINHTNVVLAYFLGTTSGKFRGIGIRGILIKWALITFFSIPPGAGKVPRGYESLESYDMDAEKRRFEDLLQKMSEIQDRKEWPKHPLFGSMTAWQCGRFLWKHTDHHLRQFGV